MMQSRTHNCGELRLSNAGQQVTIVGWMEKLPEILTFPLLCEIMYGLK